MKLLKHFQLTPVSVIVIIVLAACSGNKTAEDLEEKTSEETSSNEEESSNKLTDAEIEEGWILLFDGETTDQWRGYNQETFPTKGWAVKDDVLMVLKSGTEEEGFGGDIITKKQFGNFELQLDFMVKDTSNSGILYLVREFEGQPIWHNAPEYQILDNQTYLDMGSMDMTTHLTGDNYDLHAAPEDYSNTVSEWNTARIIVNSNHVEHWLNGNKTVEYEIGSEEWEALVKESKFAEYPEYGRAKMGHIGIQDHGYEVRFRNIKIKPL